MARYVKEQLGAEPVRHQWDNLIKLCDGLTRIKKSTSWTPQGILPMLWGGLDSNGNRTWASETIEVVLKSLSDSTRSENMIIAAVLIGNVELVTEAMTSAPRDLPFAIFDSPIQNAVRLGNSGIFRGIIKVSEAEQSKSIKEELVSQSIIFGAPAAILTAISMGQVNMLKELLDYFQAHVSRPKKGLYAGFVERAMWQEDATCLVAVLAATDGSRPRHRYQVTSADLLLACRYRQMEGIKSLMLRYNMDLNCMSNWCNCQTIQLDTNSFTASTTINSAICIAIRSGHGRSVTAVINAGADPNFPSYSGRLRTTLTPLQYAIRTKKVDTLRSLVMNGAVLPPLSEWPMTRKIYNELRSVKLDKYGTLTPTYQAFQTWGAAAPADF
jgi:hypothetical protein